MPRMSRMRRDMARRRRDMRDRRRDMRYDMGYSDRYATPEYDSRYADYNYMQSDYPTSRMARKSDREYDRHYEYPYMSDYARSRRTGRYIRDSRGMRDYADDEYLNDEELMEWSKDLLREVEPKDKGYFTKENVERKVKEMGITYDDFTFSELYTASLMLYNDYKDVIGTNNPDIYVKMARAFFNDDDAELNGSEKLAVYYDEIVCPED